MKTIEEIQKELKNEVLLHGERHVSTARLHNELGTAYFKLGEFNTALEAYQLALDIAKETVGEDDEFSIDLHYRIGRVLEARVVTEAQVQQPKVHMQENLLMRKQFDAVNHKNDQEPKIRASIDDMDSTLIYNDQAEEARLSGDLARALPLYMKSIELRRQKFGDSSPALIPVYVNYAELLRQKNECDAAKAVLDEAMAISIPVYGKEHAMTAEVMNNLGLVYRQLGELDKAQALLMEALKLRRKVLGDLDIAVGATLNNIAELLRERQDYQEAINYHHLAIEAFETTGGSEHPGTINAKGNLGITLRRYAKENMDQGATLIRDTVDYLTSHDYNEQHPWLVKFGNEHIINEAQKLSEQGKFEQSLEMYEGLLRKKEVMNQLKKPGSPNRPQSPEKGTGGQLVDAGTAEEQPDQAAQDLILISKGKFTSLLGKGRLLMKRALYRSVDEVIAECESLPAEQLDSDQSKRDHMLIGMKLLKAENLYHKADFESCLELCVEVLQGKTDLYGPDSEALVDVMVVLAECYRAQARYDEAESFLNQAVKLISGAIKADEQAIGKPAVDHLLLHVQSIVALADLHRNKGAYSVAPPLLLEAMNLCKEHLLEDDAIMGECYTSLAAVERIKGDYTQCQVYLQRALDNRVKNFGREHIKCASTQMQMADLLLRKCAWKEAETLVAEASAIRSTALQEIDMMHPVLIHSLRMEARLQKTRLQFADAQVTLTRALDGAVGKLGSTHPIVGQCMYDLAEVMHSLHQLEDAASMFDQSLELRRAAFADHAEHYAIVQSMYGVACVAMDQGSLPQALTLLEECLQSRKEALRALGGRFHSEIADISIKYGYVLLHRGQLKEAAAAFGECGAFFHNSFQDERNLRISDALMGAAAVNIERGKNRDAKYQLSLAMAIRSKYLADDKNHPMIIETLYMAAENMMRVGYFYDATEAVFAMEALVTERFGADSVEEAIAHKLHAHVLRERGKGIKASEMYEAALKVLQPVFGEKSLHVLECRIGLARCLHLNRNLGNAERAYKEVILLAGEILGKDNHTVMDIRNNIMTLKLFQKPKDGTQAVETLKNSILSFYQKNFPSGHAYIAHATGRIGMFMNSLKKDSGARHVRKALKMFDEMKQYPYSNDHPWVQELGGYQKSAAQERLSHAIQEQALSAWCMPQFDGDVNYGTVPKHYWIDLHNNTPESWGEVHYYGIESQEADAVLPIIANARERSSSPGSMKRRAQSRPAAVSPASRHASLASTAQSAAAGTGDGSGELDLAALLSATSEDGGAAVDNSAVAAAAAALQAKLLQEASTRQEVEEQLQLEQHQREGLEEQLEAEIEAKQKLDAQLAAELQEREELQRKYEESLELIKELGLKASVAAIKNDEGEDVDEIFGRQSQHHADANSITPAEGNAAETTSSPSAAGDAAEGSGAAGASEEEKEAAEAQTIQKTASGMDILTDPKAAAAALQTAADMEAQREAERIAAEEAAAALVRQKAELEAASFLYDRAMELQISGWYLKALPLFEECLRVRTLHFPDEPMTNLTRRSLARNLSLLHRWDEAEEHAAVCVAHMDKLHGFENILLVESLVVQGENMLARGVYSDAAAVLSRATKMCSRIVETDKSHNPVLGRALVRQAMCSLLLGKISEAKAMAERGSAILSKAMGINHMDTIFGIHIKCEILRHCSKFKEALNLSEQTLSARRRKYGEVHPSVAESLLQQGQCYIGVGKLLEAAPKLDLALRIRMYFFGEDSLEAAEVICEKANYAAIYCRYQEALSLHEQALHTRTTKAWENYPGLSDSYQGLGQVYTSLAWFEKATQCLDAAMLIRESLPPASDTSSFHPLIAETKCSQAMLLRVQGLYEAAKPLLDESLEERRTLFGKENIAYLSNQQEYANWLHDTGDLKNADKLTKRTIKVRRQVVGLEHPAYAESLQRQAAILIDMGMIDEAQVLVAEASQIFRMHFAEGDDFYLHINVINWKILKAFLQLALLEKKAADEEAGIVQPQSAPDTSAADGNAAAVTTTTDATAAVQGAVAETPAVTTTAADSAIPVPDSSAQPTSAAAVETPGAEQPQSANVETTLPPATAAADAAADATAADDSGPDAAGNSAAAPVSTNENPEQAAATASEADEDTTAAATDEGTDAESAVPVPKQPEFHNNEYLEVYELFKEVIYLLRKLYHSNAGGLLIKFVENNVIASSATNATAIEAHSMADKEHPEDSTVTGAAAGAQDGESTSAAAAGTAGEEAEGAVTTATDDSSTQHPPADATAEATDVAADAAAGSSETPVQNAAEGSRAENVAAADDHSVTVPAHASEASEAVNNESLQQGIEPVEQSPLAVLPEVQLLHQPLPELPETPLNPLITFMQGRLGAAMLLEYLAKQRFAESLTPQQREIFNSNESLTRLASQEVRLKPAGVPEMEDAYLLLQGYPLIDPRHTWLLRLKKEIAGVVYTLDDMEIAANNFIQAEGLRKEGKFAEADAMYEDIFLTQMASLGAVQASTSMVVAETLYAKAENCRLMGDMDLSNALYNQSITIFRKQLGSDNEGVLKGIAGLTTILYSQGMYDDAYALHSNVLLMYNKICGADSLQAARATVCVGYDLLKLGKLSEALEMAQAANRLLNHLDSKTVEDTADGRILLSYIFMHQGNFPAAREHLDKAQSLLEAKTENGKQVSKDNLMITDVHICRAEMLFVTGRVADAQKLISKAFKQRVKLFGRSSVQSDTGKSNERRMAFFESFDHLTVETSKLGSEGDDDENSRTGNSKPRKARREEAEVNDNDLETEINTAFDDVKSQFHDSNAMIAGGGGGGGEIAAGDNGTVSSYVLFVKKKPPKAALVFKGVSLAAHPLIADCATLKGRISATLGDFSDAKEMLEAGLNMTNQLVARPSQKKASMKFELVNLTAQRGHFDDAKHQHNEILQQRLQLCDEDHPDKADSLFAIARLNNLLSKYEESTQVLTEALVIRKKVYGEAHWKVAEAFAECAAVLHAKGFHADSDSLYDKSMAVFKHSFGDLHMLISTVLLGQAANARETGNFDQANAYVEQAAAMRGIIVGDTHADTAMCWFEQARITRRLGRNLETKRLLDQTIACQRDKLGKYHPFTAMTLLAMAFNLMDLAKYATAGHVYNRALQLIRKNFGKDHVLVAEGLTGVAENLRHQGFYTAAKENHDKALYIRRKILGERHHTLAESMYFIGEIFATLAKYEEATKSFDDALALQRMAFSSQRHPDIATTMHGLANVMLAQGKILDAKHMHERAFNMRKSSLSGDHPAIGHSQFCIASVFRKMGRFEQAGALFERCQNTVRDSIGSRHPMVGTIIYNTAEVANQMGRFHHAESLLLESLGIRLAVFKEVNENHPDIVESYFGLGENLRLRGLYEFPKEKREPIPELQKLKSDKEKMKKAAADAGVSTSKQTAAEGGEAVDAAAATTAAQGPSAQADSNDVAEAILNGMDSLDDGRNSDADAGVDNTATIAAAPTAVQNSNASAAADDSTAPPPPPAEAEEGGNGTAHHAETPQVYDPMADGSDLISAPTVHISAVENLNDAEAEAEGEDGEEDDDDNAGNDAFDSRTLTEDPRKYKAVPMFNRVLDMLRETFRKEHPLVFQAQHAIAEVLKALGKYDAAFEMYEAILTERKKILGDHHPDTLSTMLGLGENLRAMGKIYPESSAGSLEAKRARIAKQSISLGVTLNDHFNSLIKPTAPLPEMRPYTSTAAARMSAPLVTSRGAATAADDEDESGRPSTRGPQDAPWIFLTKKDEKEKKKKPLKIPRGFMGYEFPAEKRFIRKEENNVTRPQRTRTGDAKWLLDAAAQSVKRTFGEHVDHPLMAALMFAKGDLLKARGDYGPALQLYEQSLVMRRKIFRGSHPVIADCINAMAEVFRIDHKFKQALPMYDKALEIRIEAYGGEHPSIAEVKNNIAMLHFAQGNFEDAQQAFEEALMVCEDLLGANHPGTAVALNNLAGLLHAAEQHKQALPFYQRALAIKKQTFGDEHADVASTMNNIGLLYKSIGKYAEAQSMYEQCLAIQKKLHGEVHRDIATTLNNLAALYVLQHKRYEAKELYKDSIAMRSSLFGREHTSVASTLNNYAGLLFTLGEYGPAKDSFQDALRIRRKILGEDHPAVAETLNNIALLLFKQGMLREALPLYEKCLDIKIRAYTESNASVATTINNLAGVYHKLGHFDQATKLYQRAHTIRTVVLGAAHPDTKAMLENIKAADRDRKKWANVVASHEIAASKSGKLDSNRQQGSGGGGGSGSGSVGAPSEPGSPSAAASLSARSRSGKMEMAAGAETFSQQPSFDDNRSFT